MVQLPWHKLLTGNAGPQALDRHHHRILLLLVKFLPKLLSAGSEQLWRRSPARRRST
jgi:hypothetical protein